MLPPGACSAAIAGAVNAPSAGIGVTLRSLTFLDPGVRAIDSFRSLGSGSAHRSRGASPREPARSGGSPGAGLGGARRKARRVPRAHSPEVGRSQGMIGEEAERKVDDVGGTHGRGESPGAQQKVVGRKLSRPKCGSSSGSRSTPILGTRSCRPGLRGPERGRVHRRREAFGGGERM
jgi:hypothetical protein